MGFVALSVAAHIVFPVLLTLIGWLIAPPKVALDPQPIKASLVRLGKKRDEKLLPRKEEPPPPPPQAEKAAPAVAPAPPDKAVAIPSKDAKADPKKDAAKEPAKDAKKSLFDAFNKTGRATPDEPEGDPDGDKDGDSSKQEGERYFGLLSAVVKRNYDVSDTIPEGERRTLRATVVIKLGAAGELVDVELSKGSGNELFDAAVVGAVKKAAPFGPPPAHLRDSLKKNGVALVFSP